MNAITIEMSDEMLKKIESAAKAKEIPLESFILNVMDAIISQNDAENRFHERAARGRGREQEGLQLLRK